MKIGNVDINGKFILAPMAGVTDKAFRQICKEHGAAFTVSEMISTKALLFDDKKTKRLLSLAENEIPASVQIFGHHPETMAKGAILAQEISGCQIIDINMGCPAPKIVNNGDGSAMMRDIMLSSKVIEAVAKESPVPVTVKFRKGWDLQTINCLEFAKMAEESGASAICIHGRTRSEMYSGNADWDIIAEVKSRANIPVIANGDVFEPSDAIRILEYTKADFAMIGRGSLGNPWIFERSNALLEGKELELPCFEERIQTAVRQMELAMEHKGEHIAMLEARKHLIWYLKGVSGTKDFKNRISKLCKIEDMYELSEELVEVYGKSE